MPSVGLGHRLNHGLVDGEAHGLALGLLVGLPGGEGPLHRILGTRGLRRRNVVGGAPCRRLKRDSDRESELCSARWLVGVRDSPMIPAMELKSSRKRFRFSRTSGSQTMVAAATAS